MNEDNVSNKLSSQTQRKLFEDEDCWDELGVKKNKLRLYQMGVVDLRCEGNHLIDLSFDLEEAFHCARLTF